MDKSVSIRFALPQTCSQKPIKGQRNIPSSFFALYFASMHILWKLPYHYCRTINWPDLPTVGEMEAVIGPKGLTILNSRNGTLNLIRYRSVLFICLSVHEDVHSFISFIYSSFLFRPTYWCHCLEGEGYNSFVYCSLLSFFLSFYFLPWPRIANCLALE